MRKIPLLSIVLILIMHNAWPLDLSDYTLVDLTHPYNEDTIYWPTSPSRFEFKQLAFGETPGGTLTRRTARCRAAGRRHGID